MAWPTYSEMKEKGGIWSCPKCEGTDKWCILEMDDERGAVCERHGVIVPNVELVERRVRQHPAHVNGD